MDSKGLLAGIRVIDCATYIAGPAAATIMSDFGAEVIKIERPEGDQWRQFSRLPGTAKSELDWCWLLTARNKKSLSIDLSKPAGREVMTTLVKSADVFVTNYQPPILERFNLTWDDLRRVNDRLIYGHITGYGDRGDDAGLPAFDAFAYWARSGLMTSVTGRDGTPGAPRPGMGDHPTAMTLFAAIMMGLYQRQTTRKGTKVSTSLMAAGAWSNACDLQAKFCHAAFPQPTGGAHPPNPLAGGYITSDKKVFLLALLDPDHEFPQLCEGLGMPDLATDAMFVNNAARAEHAAELFAILQSQFESRDLAELKQLFRRFDVKYSPIPSLDDAAADPQMRAADAVIDLDMNGRGKIETVNSPIFIEGTAKRKPEVAPEIGENTREVLRGLGYADDAIEQMIRSGAAFESR